MLNLSKIFTKPLTKIMQPDKAQKFTQPLQEFFEIFVQILEMFGGFSALLPNESGTFRPVLIRTA